MHRFKLIISLCLFLISSPHVFALGINDGLVGWWKLDEGGGTSAYDSSGNGNTGTLTNGPTWITAKRGNGVSFTSGSSQYIDAGNNAVFNFGDTTGSVAFWIKASTASAQYIIAKGAAGNGANDKGWNIGINQVTAGTIWCAIKNGAGGGVLVINRESNSAINDNNWHHVVVIITTSTTVHATNTISIYIDGLLDQRAITDGSGVYNSSGTLSLSFGARVVPSAPANFFTGVLDDIRVYNRSLSSSEIAMLANNRNQIKNAGINNGQVK